MIEYAERAGLDEDMTDVFEVVIGTMDKAFLDHQAKELEKKK